MGSGLSFVGPPLINMPEGLPGAEVGASWACGSGWWEMGQGRRKLKWTVGSSGRRWASERRRGQEPDQPGAWWEYSTSVGVGRGPHTET